MWNIDIIRNASMENGGTKYLNQLEGYWKGENEIKQIKILK